MMSKDKKMGMRAREKFGDIIVYILLVIISIIWLIPFVCIVLQSFRVESTWQVGYVIPKQCGFDKLPFSENGILCRLLIRSQIHQ